MQVFAYKMCNFLKKVFQCPPNRAIFLPSYIVHRTLYIVHRKLPLVLLIVLLAADFPEQRRSGFAGVRKLSIVTQYRSPSNP